MKKLSIKAWRELLASEELTKDQATELLRLDLHRDVDPESWLPPCGLDTVVSYEGTTYVLAYAGYERYRIESTHALGRRFRAAQYKLALGE